MMKKSKIIAVTILLLNALMVKAQDTTSTGIRFEQQLKWSEILVKAKAEHKYIFVDCYATWCGPCKYMDATVYSTKQVGDVYNKEFISIKVQMDRTASDDSVTKSHYQTADMFAKNYHVNVYPTFLFFDSDGKPLHKVTGSMDARGFVQLAADAQNPVKQYYHILADFRPGKLDTADEKGLARSFAYSDKELAAKLALDYLSRIPKAQLKFQDNGMLMVQFQYDPSITSIAADYIRGLTRDQFLNNSNLEFMRAISGQEKIQQIINSYAGKLNNKEIGRKENLTFFLYFSENQRVRQIAKRFISDLAEKEINNEMMLDFLARFTTSCDETGFKFIYHHIELADKIKKDTDWTQSFVTNIIYQADFQPQLEKYMPPGVPPGFDSLISLTAKKYNSYYAKRIASDKKADWYGYLVNNKKDARYWTQLTQADIDRIKKFADSSKFTNEQQGDINDACYTDIFLHSDDTAQINLAVKWMNKEIINDPDPGSWDTYACLLYKSGKIDDALKIENKILQFCIEHREAGTFTYMKRATMAMQKMWTGDKIWEDKEFQ